MRSHPEILISLEQRYVSAMVAGEKTVELRRRALRVPTGTRVWVYAKMPRGCIQLFAFIEEVVEATPSAIWRRYGKRAAVSQSDFKTYFAGAETGYAILLTHVTELPRPIALREVRHQSTSFRPPQFFKRLQEDSPELRLLSNAIKAQRC